MEPAAGDDGNRKSQKMMREWCLCGLGAVQHSANKNFICNFPCKLEMIPKWTILFYLSPVISKVVSNLSLGDLSFPAHAKPWQLLLQSVLCSFFCNFNCHGFKVFFTRLLLLKWEIFELQAISIKKCIEGFPNIFRKQDREKRQIILCNTLRAFISSTVLSVVVMLQSGAPAGVAVRVLWFSAGTCVGERQDGPLLLPLGNLLLLQRNSQCCEVRS